MPTAGMALCLPVVFVLHVLRCGRPRLTRNSSSRALDMPLLDQLIDAEEVS